MPDAQIRFDNGAAYEDFMGKWSRLAGDTFLDWLAPAAGWRWADIGCGNGAFTEMIVQRHAPDRPPLRLGHGEIAHVLDDLVDAPVEHQLARRVVLDHPVNVVHVLEGGLPDHGDSEL